MQMPGGKMYRRHEQQSYKQQQTSSSVSGAGATPEPLTPAGCDLGAAGGVQGTTSSAQGQLASKAWYSLLRVWCVEHGCGCETGGQSCSREVTMALGNAHQQDEVRVKLAPVVRFTYPAVSAEAIRMLGLLENVSCVGPQAGMVQLTQET